MNIITIKLLINSNAYRWSVTVLDWSAAASVDFLQEDNEMVLAEIELCMLYEAMDKLQNVKWKPSDLFL